MNANGAEIERDAVKETRKNGHNGKNGKNGWKYKRKSDDVRRSEEFRELSMNS